jgi:hypothetical protein
MIVICIDDKHFGSKKKTRLTLYKKYKVITSSYVGFQVVNDEGELETFDDSRFVRLDTHRLKRLNILGI